MSTAVAESTGTSVDQLIQQINGFKAKWEEIESSRLTIALEIGQACNELKAQCKLAKLKWGPVRDTLPFHQTTISDYMRIAKYWDECDLDDADDIANVDRALSVIYDYLDKNDPAANLIGMDDDVEKPADQPADFDPNDEEDEEEEEENQDTNGSNSPSPKKAKKEKPKPSHVVMVQLFLNTTINPLFEADIKLLNEHYGTTNTTDAVLGAIRREVERIQNKGKEDHAQAVVQLADKIAEETKK